MELSFKKYLEINKEETEKYNKESLIGNLKCSCGSYEFNLYHTGRVTKGILLPYVVKTQKQIFLEAVCSSCNKRIQLYDSCVDGEKPIIVPHPEKKKLEIKGVDKFKLEICLNYMNDDYYFTNKFFTFYLYWKTNNKDIVIYEE